MKVLHTAGTIPFWRLSKHSNSSTKEPHDVIIAFFSFTSIGLLLAVVVFVTSHLKKLRPPQLVVNLIFYVFFHRESSFIETFSLFLNQR